MTIFSVYPFRELMRSMSFFQTFSIQLPNQLSFCAHMVITFYWGSPRHWTYHGTILHTWQFKQVVPSYTKSHFEHSLRTLIFFLGTSPLEKRSSSFTVYNPYWIITSRDGNLILKLLRFNVLYYFSWARQEKQLAIALLALSIAAKLSTMGGTKLLRIISTHYPFHLHQSLQWDDWEQRWRVFSYGVQAVSWTWQTPSWVGPE